MTVSSYVLEDNYLIKAHNGLKAFATSMIRYPKQANPAPIRLHVRSDLCRFCMDLSELGARPGACDVN